MSRSIVSVQARRTSLHREPHARRGPCRRGRWVAAVESWSLGPRRALLKVSEEVAEHLNVFDDAGSGPGAEFVFLQRSHSRLPSIRSSGGAPSRVASAFASGVNVPVVIRSPL